MRFGLQGETDMYKVGAVPALVICGGVVLLWKVVRGRNNRQELVAIA